MTKQQRDKARKYAVANNWGEDSESEELLIEALDDLDAKDAEIAAMKSAGPIRGVVKAIDWTE